MRSLLLRAASLAVASLVLAVPALPGAAAAPCPSWTSRTFEGMLLPGETDTITVWVILRGNVSFQFVPANPFWDPLGQPVTMTVGGNRMTGTGSLAITLVQAAPGAYAVQLRGHVLGMDGMAALPYRLMVTERDCQFP